MLPGELSLLGVGERMEALRREAGQYRLARRAQAQRGVGVDGPAWPAFYEVRVAGQLDDRWSEWFGGLQIRRQGRETILSGAVRDQSTLRDVLDQLRDLGLVVVAVRRPTSEGGAAG